MLVPLVKGYKDNEYCTFAVRLERGGKFMFAIVEVGGKQYKVEPNTYFKTEKMDANVGDKVYFRAKTENQTIGKSDQNFYRFIMTGKISASGNIQTLLKADGSRTDAPAYCYKVLFTGCTSLTTAPALPATTLANRCYSGMF